MTALLSRRIRRLRVRCLFLMTFVFAHVPLAWPAEQVACPIQLRDVTSQTGITFRHNDGSHGKYYIVESMSAGVALFDYDSDGDIDVYFLNGAPMGESQSGALPRNALYRNDGRWKFTDVTQQAGVGDTGHGLGVCAGDYDNDGDPDLYLNNFGANVLYRNNADGTFTDVTQIAGVQNGERVGAGVTFLDIDADGDLDLYVGNYLQFSFALHVPRTKMGFPIYGSPIDYDADSDTLYRNNGDGTFTDVSGPSGIAAHVGTTMGLVSADYDADGDTDILIANDGLPNFLFQNDGTGKFTEVGLLSGFAYDATGRMHASMAVECGDFNNDGGLDFHVTSFQHEQATLYANLGSGLLEDVTNRVGAGSGTRSPVTWGNGFADFDRDGDRDLFVACGHMYDQIAKFDQTTAYEVPNLLLENLGTGRFRNVSDSCGDGLDARRSSRGIGLDDLDNDGDVDVVILNSRREPMLLKNESRSGHWIQLQLQGVLTNRDGVGARVEVIAGDLELVDEVHSGRGYQSHHGTRLYFGLGSRTRVDRVRVKWLGGAIDEWKNLPVDRRFRLVEKRKTLPSRQIGTAEKRHDARSPSRLRCGPDDHSACMVVPVPRREHAASTGRLSWGRGSGGSRHRCRLVPSGDGRGAGIEAGTVENRRSTESGLSKRL